MSSYKLTYFNGRGRGEIARMLFVAAGVSYQDDRVEFADWKELQPKTPLGSLPILEIDGKTKLIESKAIYKYLAREFGYYGKSNMESIHIDMVCDIVGDMWAKITKAFFMKDEKEKLSLADITFIQFMEYNLFPGQNDNGLDKYPKLKELKERVCSNPKIAAWIAERPTAPF